MTGDKPVGQTWSSLAVGYGSVCGLAAGAAYCWGYGLDGELGNGTTASTDHPSAVLSNRSWTSVSVGTSHACAIDTTGAAYCWGRNASGQLGNGSNTDDSVPVPVTFAGTWNAIAAGEANTCGVASTGNLYCWGADNYGQLGQGASGGPDQLVPLLVPSLSGVTDVQLGQDHACATTDQSVYCWGRNHTGQIGNGSMGGVEATPHQVSSGLFSGLLPQLLSLGSDHSMVLMGVPSPTPPPPTPALPSSAPRQVTAASGDASASVSWTAPASSGSYPVTTYQVVSTPGGRMCLTSGLSCTIDGLANGTTYTFTVKALTGAGWSVASEPSNAVTPSGPSIVIRGSREGRRVVVYGSTSGFGMGAELVPWVRIGGGFEKGLSAVLVSADGTFRWERRSPRGKGLAVYVEGDGVRSNMVVVR